MIGRVVGVQIVFYWDVFLILNFIMNLFLMGMTGLLRRKYFVKKRLFLAALAGSVQMTVAVGAWMILEKRGWFQGRAPVCFFFLAVIVGWEMLQLAFRETVRREKWRNFWGMIQVSVLTGGCIFLLRGWSSDFFCAGTGIGLVLVGALGVFLVFFLGRCEAGRRELQSHVMDGVLTARNGSEYPLRVLFDSGNGLVSPYTGEAVMIIDKELAETMELEKQQNPLWIPFHSIGGDGLLPAYRFPCLVLQNGQKRKNFLAAVSDNISGDGTVQMILNSKW